MLSGAVSGDIEALIKTTNQLSRNQTRQESQDAIHKQLAAFEKLLQHAMSRFSTEKLYNALKVVTREAKSDGYPKSGNSRVSTEPAFKLRGTKQLRSIFEKLRRSHHGSIGGSDIEHAIKYFDMFINDLLYLKDLKKYFTDEIHSGLMRYHYDPSIASKATDAAGPTTSTPRDKMDDNDSGHGSQAEVDDIKRLTKGVSRKRRVRANVPQKDDKKNTSEKLYLQTVEELKSILKKWTGLLTEDDLDLNDFDPDSYYEMMQFNNYSEFEPILRLVPDIFAKCYKCIDLSKVWLREANVVLKDLPQKPRTPNPPPPPPPLRSPSPLYVSLQPGTMDRLSVSGDKEPSRQFLRQIRAVELHIENVDKAIVEDEKHLSEYTKQMEDLQGRDERFTKISSDYERIDSLLIVAAGQHQKSKSEQLALANKLKGVPKDSPQHRVLKGHLIQLDDQVSENYWKLKSLEFEKSLITDDYLVEMEVRPSFIRFVGDTKSKIQELQEFVQSKKEEKVRLDKQLALMKTNTERMRKIMRTYLGSASSHVDNSADLMKDLTMESALSESFLGPEDRGRYVSSDFDPDGNDADDDSAGPYDVSPRFLQPVRTVSAELPKRTFTNGAIIGRREDGWGGMRPQSFHAVEAQENTSTQTPAIRVSRIPQIKEIRRRPKASIKAKRVWENM